MTSDFAVRFASRPLTSSDESPASPTIGLEADDHGRIYAGDYERNGIRQRSADGEWKTIAHDPRILWPDTLSVASDGYLYFTANQLHRQAQFNNGVDQREKPYSLFRVETDGGPVKLI
jgi:sugar lactone lactonase YvrE